MSDEQEDEETRKDGVASASRTSPETSTQERGRANRIGAGRLYTRVVYVRVTDAEWTAIQRRAQGSEFSMSRFLVRAALARKSLPSREERARLEGLHYRLRRAAIRLRQLAALRWMQTADPETVEMIRETATLLEGLVQEMSRRIYGKGTG